MNLSKYNNRFSNLIEADIRKKKLIKTGDLIRSIDPVFHLSNNKITIKLGAIHYFKYLDDGTRYIKSYNITKDVMNTQEFLDIIEDIIFDGIDSDIDIILS